jgi:hypothetical protein
MLTLFKVLVTAAWMLAKLFVEEIEILPEDEVIGALELLNELDPEIATSPAAEIAALGSTVVPPLIVRLPAEVSVPVPPYVPDGVILMLPELVVAWFAPTETSPPKRFMSPATLVATPKVIPALLPDLPKVSPLVPVNAQVGSRDRV